MKAERLRKKQLKERRDSICAMFLEDESENIARWKSNEEKAMLKSYFALNPKVKEKLDAKGIDFNLVADDEITHEKLIEIGFEFGEVGFFGIRKMAYRKFSFIVDVREDGSFYYSWIGGNKELKTMSDIDNIYTILSFDGRSIYY